MIERIILRNFQKHRKLDLTFDNVTTLIGPSDVGKSAIIRAIRWVVTNSPKGQSFMRHGAKKCSVTLFVDGHKIKRIRSGSVNSYWMDGHTYSSFSTGVPEPIQEVLRLSAENFQQQHDAIFWLSLSPAEVSKRLNEIADLQIMDDSIRKALSIRKECEHRVKFCKEQKQLARKSLKQLRVVPEMVGAFTALEQSQEILVQNRTDCTRLRNCLAVGRTASESVERLETPTQELSSLVKMEKKRRELARSIESLRRLVEAASIPLPTNMNKLNIGVGLSLLADKNAAVDRIALLVSTHNVHHQKEEQCQSRLESLKDSLSKISVMCPKCGRPMPTEK